MFLFPTGQPGSSEPSKDISETIVRDSVQPPLIS